jgi:hypothetical protein
VIHEITRFFYMPQSWDMGRIFYFPSEGRHAWGFLPHRKNPTASAGIEPVQVYLFTTNHITLHKSDNTNLTSLKAPFVYLHLKQIL